MKAGAKRISGFVILALFMLFFYGGTSTWAFQTIEVPTIEVENPYFVVLVDSGLFSSATKVTNDSANEYFPSLDNGYAFWYKSGDGIYKWDTSRDVSTAQKVISDSHVSSLSSSGENVAYWSIEELSMYDPFTDEYLLHLHFDNVYLWDGSNATLLSMNGQKPSISGNNVAYSKYDGHDYEIVVKKGAYEAQVTNNSHNDYSPSLFGETVAWFGNDGHDFEIYYWDGHNTVQLTSNGLDDKYPSLYDGKVAWQGYDGHDWEIYYYDGNRILQITSNDYDDLYPSLYNGKIAWQGHVDGDYEIFYFDGSEIKQVTQNNDDDLSPSLFNGAILWRQSNGSRSDIFYMEVDVPQKPTVSTFPAQNITQTSGKIRGSVNPNGQATTYYFEWGTSTSYDHETAHRDAGSGKNSITVDETIANLTPGTTYHYRLVAQNPSGTSYGSDRTFTTTAISVSMPTASTGSASDVTENTAILSGTINPQGAETRFRFEYGPDTSYGSATPWFAAGNGTSELSVNATITGLTPSTTYHFRIVAENSAGTVTGDDATFTTEALTDPAADTRERFTGWWYDSTQPGTGLAVAIQDNNKVFLAWFVYDAQGRTTWYASGGSMANENTYVGELRRWTGWAWGTEPYSMPTSQVVGSVTLIFNKGSNDSISFTATVNGTVVTNNYGAFMKDFAPGDKDSRNLTGWWYDPNYNGMGFYLDARGGKMAMVWYNYRDDHSPRWWTSTGAFADGAAAYSGALDGWMNGQCVGCPFTSPPQMIPGEGGTITINFTDADHATATVGSTTINLQRFLIP